jgi:hypothetical protein
MKRAQDPESLYIQRALLNCFDDDEPPADAKQNAMAAMGIAFSKAALGAGLAAGSLAASSSASTGSVAAPVATVSAATSASKLAVVLALQWLGVGALGGVAVLGTTHLATMPHVAPQAVRAEPRPSRPSGEPAATAIARVTSPEHEPAAAVIVAPPAREARVPEHEFSTERATVAPSKKKPPSLDLEGERAERQPSVVPTADRTEPATSSVASSNLPSSETPMAKPRPRPTLGGEIGLLDYAGVALSANDAPQALSLLDQYDRAYPHGSLWPEAVVMRIEALVKAGNLARAMELRDRARGTLPDRYAQRIEQILAK